jgi:hypothetical protein
MPLTDGLTSRATEAPMRRSKESAVLSRRKLRFVVITLALGVVTIGVVAFARPSQQEDISTNESVWYAIHVKARNMYQPILHALLVRSLEEDICNAVRNGITRDNLHMRISVPPAVDTSTIQGQILHSQTGFTADEETLDLVRQADSLTYWIVQQTEDNIRLAGIAWDCCGQPHYFRAERR